MIRPEPHPTHSLLAVLDLETSTDPQALAILHGDPKRPPTAWAMQRIDVACMMLAEVKDGTITVTNFIALDTHAPTRHHLATEPSILKVIADALDTPALPTTLVTFNGKLHDLPILRRRAYLNGQGSRPTFAKRPPFRHVDAMVELDGGSCPKPVKLVQAAGGLGIPVLHRFPARRAPPASMRMRKCEVDVAATFLLHFHNEAMAGIEPDLRHAAWEALSAHIEGGGPAGEHMLQFVRMHRLRG